MLVNEQPVKGEVALISATFLRLKAEKFVMATGAPGILDSLDDPQSGTTDRIPPAVEKRIEELRDQIKEDEDRNAKRDALLDRQLAEAEARSVSYRRSQAEEVKVYLQPRGGGRGRYADDLGDRRLDGVRLHERSLPAHGLGAAAARLLRPGLRQSRPAIGWRPGQGRRPTASAPAGRALR